MPEANFQFFVRQTHYPERSRGTIFNFQTHAQEFECGFGVDSSWKSAGKDQSFSTQYPNTHKYLTSQVFLSSGFSKDFSDFSPAFPDAEVAVLYLFEDYLYTLSPAPTITTKLIKE